MEDNTQGASHYLNQLQLQPEQQQRQQQKQQATAVLNVPLPQQAMAQQAVITQMLPNQGLPAYQPTALAMDHLQVSSGK